MKQTLEVGVSERGDYTPEAASSVVGASAEGGAVAAAGGLFAMQRANGDWFAFDEGGRLRVPIFRSKRDGMQARVSHWGMRLFKPVILDEDALKEIVPADGAGETEFWLVDNPYTGLKRGRSLERAQLSLLVHEAA